MPRLRRGKNRARDGEPSIARRKRGLSNSGPAGGDQKSLGRKRRGTIGSTIFRDANFVAFDGTRLKGRVAIADFHRGPFKTHLRGMKIVIAVTETRKLADTVYLVCAEGGPVRDDGAGLAGEVQTFVCHEFSVHWSIASFHNTPVRPLRGPRTSLLW